MDVFLNRIIALLFMYTSSSNESTKTEKIWSCKHINALLYENLQKFCYDSFTSMCTPVFAIKI